MSNGSKEILDIFLVHGTWGRGFFPNLKNSNTSEVKGNSWFDEGSSFRLDLEEKLNKSEYKYRIHKCTWSGENSIYERAVAAKTIEKQVSALVSNNTSPKLFIGHSHGGNILNHMMKQFKHLEDSYFVSLATPYVGVSFRKKISLFRDGFPLALIFSIGIPSLIYFTIGFAIYLLSFIATHVFGSKIFQSAKDGLDASFLYIAQSFVEFDLNHKIIAKLILLVIVLIIVITSIWFVGVSSESKVKEIAQINEDGITFNPRVNALVLRAPHDEAYYVLKAASVGDLLSIKATKAFILYIKIFIWSITIFSILSIIMLYVLPFGHVLHIPGTPPDDRITFLKYDSMRLYILGFITGTLPFVCSLAAFVLFIAALLRSLCGRELMTSSMNCDLIVHVTPDNEGLVRVKTLPGKKNGLYHSIYNHKNCANNIINWLDSVSGNRNR